MVSHIQWKTFTLLGLKQMRRHWMLKAGWWLLYFHITYSSVWESCILTHERSSKSSWKLHIMKSMCMEFKIFCIKIHSSSNSFFPLTFWSPFVYIHYFSVMNSNVWNCTFFTHWVVTAVLHIQGSLTLPFHSNLLCSIGSCAHFPTPTAALGLNPRCGETALCRCLFTSGGVLALLALCFFVAV